jgi:hypothetical protein
VSVRTGAGPTARYRALGGFSEDLKNISALLTVPEQTIASAIDSARKYWLRSGDALPPL